MCYYFNVSNVSQTYLQTCDLCQGSIILLHGYYVTLLAYGPVSHENGLIANCHVILDVTVFISAHCTE